MASVQNTYGTYIYAEDWSATLQARLNKATRWKEICKVRMSDVRVFNNPYLTDPVVANIGRGTAYTHSQVTETNDYATISTGKIVPQYKDYADWAQTKYLDQMEMAKTQAQLLDEAVETALYADHANFTDFGSEDLAGSTGSTAITVSATNVDDIIRTVRQKIFTANGGSLMEQNGLVFVWRPADMNYLEQFCQANGYQMADVTLKNGVPQGFTALGARHYASNLLSTSHVFAGVAKTYDMGVLKSTYGQIELVRNPAGASGGNLSGMSVVSRVDFGGKVWNNVSALLYDVNVA